MTAINKEVRKASRKSTEFLSKNCTKELETKAITPARNPAIALEKLISSPCFPVTLILVLALQLSSFFGLFKITKEKSHPTKKTKAISRN
jgi:hypothetical protein